MAEVAEAPPLRRFGHYTLTNEGTFNAAVMMEPLVDEVFQEFEELLSVLLFVKSVLVPFRIVQKNYDELEGGLRAIAERMSSAGASSLAEVRESIHDLPEAGRLVTNFLSSVRSFLDQTDHALSHRFGKTSSEREGWEAVTARSFDASFSYRFLYKLRNYSQHYGVPFSNLQVNGKADEEGVWTFSARPLLDRDKLLAENFNWTAKLRTQLETADRELELMPLIRDHMSQLANLCRYVVLSQLPGLSQASRYLEVLRRTLKIPDGAIGVIWVGENQGPDAPPRRTVIIPFEELEFVQGMLVSVWPVELKVSGCDAAD